MASASLVYQRPTLTVGHGTGIICVFCIQLMLSALPVPRINKKKYSPRWNVKGIARKHIAGGHSLPHYVIGFGSALQPVAYLPFHVSLAN